MYVDLVFSQEFKRNPYANFWISFTLLPISTQKIAEEGIRIRDRVSAIGDYGIEPNENSQEIMNLILSDEYDVFYILAGHTHFEIKDNLNERIVEEVSAPAFQGVVNVIKIDNQEVEEKWKIYW